MHKVDLRADAKEAACIERRRNLERDRKARIFNARERRIGLDEQVLSRQVKEREEHESTEKLRDQAFATDMIRNDKIAELLQQRQEKDARQLNKSVVEFRKEQQRVQDRREFDLYDPDTKRKSLPARVSDEDPRMTVSCLQRFEGEDLTCEERKKLQQEQLREWTGEQAAEKDRLAMEQREADRLHELKAREMDQRAVEMEEAEMSTRKALNDAMKEYNQALSKEKAAQHQRQAVEEQDDNLTEISNNIHGDLLSENPEVSQSAFGPHRVVPDRWKGMSPGQVQQIRETQEAQRREKEQEKSQEREVEKEWERRTVAVTRAGLVMESQLEKKKKQLAKELAEQNRQLAAEQRARQEYIAKEVYTNKPSMDYFNQFNTCSR